MKLPIEQMKRLAEIMTGHTAKIYGVRSQAIRVLPGRIFSSYWFAPSTTGADWQKVQALQVIIKAYKETGITFLKDERGFPVLPDHIFYYAALALLKWSPRQDLNLRPTD